MIRAVWMDASQRSRQGQRAGPIVSYEFYSGQVNASTDDAVEAVSDGSIDLLNLDGILLGGDDLLVPAHLAGLRFAGVAMAQGEVVTQASIRFMASKSNGKGCVIRIRAEATDNALPFSSTTNDISSRALTTAYVDWDIPAWTTDQDDASTTSPNLSSVVSEVLDRPGWSPGNAIAFVLSLSPANTDPEFPRRRPVSYDENPAGAARLAINADTDPDVPVSLEMRGDTSFSLTDISDTVDEFGVSPRTWYTRMKDSANQSGNDYLSDEFDSNSNRPMGRTGNMFVTQLLIAFRYTGDLELLDRAVTLQETAWNLMTVESSGSRYWGGYDQELDVPLTSGMLACIAWACRNNQDLTSPAGHNYGAIATKYQDWLTDDFIPRWQALEGGTPQLPPFRKGQQHTWINMARTLWYISRLGGGGAYTAQEYADAAEAMIDERLSVERTADVGFGGRTARFWMHSVTNTPGDLGTAACLQYATYVRYEIPALIDMYLDGGAPQLSASWWQTAAASVSDFILDGDPYGTGEPLSRTIGGEMLDPSTVDCTSYTQSAGVNRGGILYHHCYRGRSDDVRLVEMGSYAMMAGWDSRGRIASVIQSYYPSWGTAELPRYPAYPASRFFTLMFHGG